MGGTLAAKSVRHAFEVLAEIREAKGGSREGLGIWCEESRDEPPDGWYLDDGQGRVNIPTEYQGLPIRSTR